MKKIAVSIGDVNGIGLEIALKAHNIIKDKAQMLYFVDSSVVARACELLQMPLPSDFNMISIKDSCSLELQNLISKNALINARESKDSQDLWNLDSTNPRDSKDSQNQINKFCGEYSFNSVKNALNAVKCGEADALLTLPIHKKSWNLAGISFVGHTDFLSAEFGDKGIMMLGCDKTSEICENNKNNKILESTQETKIAQDSRDSRDSQNLDSINSKDSQDLGDRFTQSTQKTTHERMFVALFSDHIPLSKVPQTIEYESLVRFLLRFAKSFAFQKALVLGLNPHAGDGGVLGSEDCIIKDSINAANARLGREKFIGAISPDVAFSPRNRAKFDTFVAMYHDQGLIALKALYFDESINITLGLPILRVSVDHGVAFDIAYQNKASIKSYLNAVKFILESS